MSALDRARSWRGVVLAAVVLGSGVSAPARVDAAPSTPVLAALRSQLQLSIAYNQGIARIPGGWILSGTNYPKPASDVLVRTDEQFKVLAANAGAIPAAWKAQHYVHIGDIDVVGNVLYAPFEQPDYTLGHQVMARYDATTLRFLDAVVVAQHENGFVTVDPRTSIAYSMDHFDGATLQRYDVAHGWKPLAPLALSLLLHSTQGASVADGSIWISTSDDHNDVYRVSATTGHVDLVAQVVHPQGEGEGIAVAPLATGYLHVLVIDPDQTKVWVEHFAEPAGVAHHADRTLTWLVAVAVALVVLLGAGAALVRRRQAGGDDR